MENPKTPSEYTKRLIETLSGLDMEKVSLLSSKLQEMRGGKRTLFLAGNGGSAAIASHAACDFGKTILYGGRSIRTICLNDNIPLMTAWANDTGYENVFAGQLTSLASEGDLLVVVSSSGNSKNILKVLEEAKRLGVETFAFVGFDGGKAKDMADNFLHVQNQDYGIVEDIHMMIVHAITDSLKANT